MAQPEVHVGDVGTLYSVSLLEGDLPYDPSSADDVTLLFEVPDGTVYERTAEVTSDGGSPSGYRVEYTTTADDAETLHGTAGRLKIQVRLEWDDGRQFHSSIEIADDDGAELRIYKNLEPAP